MKRFGNWFWGGILGVALIAIAGGFFGGSSLQGRGSMPAAVAVPEVAPAPIERALFGPRGDASLTPFDPPVEAAVVDRPDGWAPPTSSNATAGRLAIVICGMGVDGTLDSRFSAIPYPLSFAVPALGNVPTDVRRSDAKALLVEADAHVTIDKIAARFARVHAGGVITPVAGAPGHAEALAARLHASGAFLVDGMANGSSTFYDASHDEDVPAATRDIVIDAYQEQAYVTYMLRQAVRLAQRTGVAIAVGHAYPETYEALRQSLQPLTRDGDVEVVPVGELAR